MSLVRSEQPPAAGFPSYKWELAPDSRPNNFSKYLGQWALKSTESVKSVVYGHWSIPEDLLSWATWCSARKLIDGFTKKKCLWKNAFLTDYPALIYIWCAWQCFNNWMFAKTWRSCKTQYSLCLASQSFLVYDPVFNDADTFIWIVLL